ncbi:MAG: biotin--[Alistipes sp.]|nr:biotin--[acetyl-CoA-carboxylase] ligase [Alistipes sp.]MBQ5921794.1 biotin--[acetyl-CoA-carboxylase] ligase [Alistipes sp.]
MIYRFDILPSTNDEATATQYVEGDIILAQCQTAGRGQRGHTWESREGENLTFSLLLEPLFLPPSEQFLISECVALGVCDALLHYGIEAQIKWTNDIYIGDRKLAGILIEHKLQGSALARTVAGIGLNVNQKAFSDDLPNPISMAQATGREFDREEVLQTVATSLMARYEQLREGGAKELQADYHQRLYRLGQEHCYALPDGSRFRGIIRGVEPTGALRIENERGELLSFLFKEVEFVIQGR